MKSSFDDKVADSKQSDAMTSLAIPINPPQETVSLDWAKLLSDHRRWLATVVRSRISNPSAVDDVLQEVALAVWKQANRPVDREKVPAFLYRIALRKVVNHHRVAGRRKKLMDGYFGQQPSNAGVVDTSPGEWLINEELVKDFRIAFQYLNDKDRELLMLKYTEGWGYRELAQHLGVSVKTIEYRLLKARQALRVALAKNGEGEWS